MQVNKKGRGRPRKYASDAERKKAYRIRKKKKIAVLEAKVKELEAEVKNMSEIAEKMTPELKEVHEEITVPWMKLTPMDIASMETEKLKHYRRILQNQFSWKRIKQHPLYAGLTALARPKDSEDWADYWKSQDRRLWFIESFQQVVLIYLIEAELASRKREMNEENMIEKLEERIGDLEKNFVAKRD